MHVLCSFLTYEANDKKKIKEIVCRNLKDKEQAKKLVEDYNARYGKVNFVLFFISWCELIRKIPLERVDSVQSFILKLLQAF